MSALMASCWAEIFRVIGPRVEVGRLGVQGGAWSPGVVRGAQWDEKGEGCAAQSGCEECVRGGDAVWGPNPHPTTAPLTPPPQHPRSHAPPDHRTAAHAHSPSRTDQSISATSLEPPKTPQTQELKRGQQLCVWGVCGNPSPARAAPQTLNQKPIKTLKPSKPHKIPARHNAPGPPRSRAG